MKCEVEYRKLGTNQKLLELVATMDAHKNKIAME
jgi:hypothetical protein